MIKKSYRLKQAGIIRQTDRRMDRQDDSYIPPHNIVLRAVIKAIAEGNINVTQKLKLALGRVENIVGKKRKCCLGAFSPFPAKFLKPLKHFPK